MKKPTLTEQNKEYKSQIESLLADKRILMEDNTILLANNKELQKELESSIRKKEDILLQGNLRADFIKRILDILMGDAREFSKYEVIKDMFKPQFDEFAKELEAGNFNNPTYLGNMNFLSDRIYEDPYA